MNERIYAQHGTLYTLSDGTHTHAPGEGFAERAALKREAETLAHLLKYTKKIQGTELEEIWLNDPQVRRYRELLRQIWAFRAPDVVAAQDCCYYCDATDGLQVARFLIGAGEYTRLVCPAHLEHLRAAWENVHVLTSQVTSSH